jgi:hypothetical protein
LRKTEGKGQERGCELLDICNSCPIFRGRCTSQSQRNHGFLKDAQEEEREKASMWNSQAVFVCWWRGSERVPLKAGQLCVYEED